MIARAVISRTAQALFIQKGWKVTPVVDGWRLDRPGSSKRPVYAGLGDHWLTFSQYLDHPDNSDSPRTAELYRKLLTINERKMFLTKFALTAGGDLTLAAEVPLIGNYLKLVEKTLDAVMRYGSLYPDNLNGGGTVETETPTSASRAFAIPADTFREFVSKIEMYNWGPMKKPVGQSWHLGYKSPLRLYHAYFGVSNSWAAFQIPVLLNRESIKPSGSQRLFLRYLLRLNDELCFVKFGIGEDGQILLLVELPIHELDYELFLFAIRTISKYLELYAQELEIMAAPELDQNIFTLLLKGDANANRSNIWS